MVSKRIVFFVLVVGFFIIGLVFARELESISSGKFRSPLLKRNLDFRVFAPG